MAGRHCEHELLHEQWRHLQVVADGKSEHSDVEAPDAQLVDDVVGLGLGQTQTEFGELCSNLGHDVGESDGILGAGTRAAVREEQARLGLPADAWPTRALLDAL